MPYDLRVLDPKEVGRLHEAMSYAFHFDPKGEWEKELGEFLEWDRTWGVFDGEEIVGTGGNVSLELTVPGGTEPTAGLTVITVRPTHRRQGILTQMMRRHFSDARERGEKLAALYASEAIIYGRFGYGLAIEPLNYQIDRRHAVLHPRSVDGSVKITPPDKAIPTVAEIYAEVGKTRPGWIARRDGMWERRFRFDPPDERRGYTRRLIAVYEEGGEALGYAEYRTKSDWTDEGMPQGKVKVNELMATTLDAEWALWSYLLSIDLTQTITVRNRPADDPLPLMLTDSRRLRRSVGENLWARLVDVRAALQARRYAVEGQLVLEVYDTFLPENQGRYRLSGGPDGAECVITDERPDLVVDVADLGSWYLGGVKPSRSAAAGRIEGRDAALGLADAMFGWHPAPWCVQFF